MEKEIFFVLYSPSEKTYVACNDLSGYDLSIWPVYRVYDAKQFGTEIEASVFRGKHLSYADCVIKRVTATIE